MELGALCSWAGDKSPNLSQVRLSDSGGAE